MIIVKHKGSGVSYSNSELLDWSGLLTEVLGTADEQKRSVRVSGRYWCAVTQQILEVTATNDKEWEAMKRLPRRNWTGDFLLESKCKRRRLNRSKERNSVDEATSSGRPAPIPLEESVPVEEEDIPGGDKTTPVVEEVAPDEEEASAIEEEAAPCEEEDTPAEEEAAPADEEAAPTEEEAAPAEEEAAPAKEEAAPAKKEAAPADEEAAPAEEEAAPADEEAAPAEEVAAPANEEVAPAEEEAAPAKEEAAPAGEEAAPAGEEASPIGEEGVPAVKETVFIVGIAAPVNDRARPMKEEAASLEKAIPVAIVEPASVKGNVLVEDTAVLPSRVTIKNSGKSKRTNQLNDSLLKMNSFELLKPKTKKSKQAVQAYKKDDFVIVEYEKKLFPGQIIAIDEEDCTVKCMEKVTIPGSVWKWPSRDDIADYPKKKVMRKIPAPTAVPSRSRKPTFKVPELL